MRTVLSSHLDCLCSCPRCFSSRRFSVDGFEQDDTYATLWSVRNSSSKCERELRVKAVTRSIVVGGFASISSGRSRRRGNDHWARRVLARGKRKIISITLIAAEEMCCSAPSEIQSNWTKRASKPPAALLVFDAVFSSERFVLNPICFASRRRRRGSFHFSIRRTVVSSMTSPMHRLFLVPFIKWILRSSVCLCCSIASFLSLSLSLSLPVLENKHDDCERRRDR